MLTPRKRRQIVKYAGTDALTWDLIYLKMAKILSIPISHSRFQIIFNFKLDERKIVSTSNFHYACTRKQSVNELKCLSSLHSCTFFI